MPETKPLEEIEALRLEKVELQMRLLQEQLWRLAAESKIMIGQAAERAEVPGWQLDLAQRLWVKPETSQSGGVKKNGVKENADNNQ